MIGPGTAKNVPAVSDFRPPSHSLSWEPPINRSSFDHALTGASDLLVCEQRRQPNPWDSGFLGPRNGQSARMTLRQSIADWNRVRQQKPAWRRRAANSCGSALGESSEVHRTACTCRAQCAQHFTDPEEDGSFHRISGTGQQNSYFGLLRVISGGFCPGERLHRGMLLGGCPVLAEGPEN